MSTKRAEPYELLAEYKCQKCGQTWKERARMVKCIICKFIYVDWINHPLTIEYESK